MVLRAIGAWAALASLAPDVAAALALREDEGGGGFAVAADGDVEASVAERTLVEARRDKDVVEVRRPDRLREAMTHEEIRLQVGPSSPSSAVDEEPDGNGTGFASFAERGALRHGEQVLREHAQLPGASPAAGAPRARQGHRVLDEVVPLKVEPSWEVEAALPPDLGLLGVGDSTEQSQVELAATAALEAHQAADAASRTTVHALAETMAETAAETTAETMTETMAEAGLKAMGKLSHSMSAGGASSAGKCLCFAALFAGLLYYLEKMLCSEQGCCDLRSLACVRTLFRKMGIDKYKTFSLLVTVHSCKELEPGDYFVWVMPRPAGHSSRKPPRSCMKLKPSNQRTQTGMAWQEQLVIQCVQGRPELQFALFRSQRVRESKYIGSVGMRVFEDLLQPNSLPREKWFSVMSDGGSGCKKIGALKLSFYIKDPVALRKLGFISDRLSLSFMNCVEEAKGRLERANAEAHMRGMKPYEVNRVNVLARALTGDVLKANQNGVLKRQYFEMVCKKDRWFWIWYKSPHSSYEPSTFEDLGEVFTRDLPRGTPSHGEETKTKKSRDVEAHVPVRAISSVNLVAGDQQTFLVQYRMPNKSRSDLVLASVPEDAVRGRDEIIQGLRSFIETIREADEADDDPYGITLASQSQSLSVSDNPKDSARSNSSRDESN